MEHDLFSHIDLPRVYRRRKRINAMMLGLTGLMLALAIVPLLWIIGYVFLKGGSHLNIDFFIHLPQPMGATGGGVLHAIEGSFIMVILASIFSVPPALLAAFYLTTFPNAALSGSVRFATDLLAGMPSIIIGLFGYAVIVVTQKHYSTFAGSVVLAIIMLPVVIRSAEEMLKLVPATLRAGSLALGAPEWKTAIKVVLPAATEGIVTGIMLAIDRATGETAPLLFTALGNDNFEVGKIIKQGITGHQTIGAVIGQILNQPADALPLTLWKYAQQPYPERVEQAWTIALVLMLFVLALNITARLWLAKRKNSCQRP